MKFLYLVLILALSFSPAFSADYRNIVIYRDIDGKLTEISKENLKLLKQEAKDLGNVTIWVMFDMQYEYDKSERSPNVRQSEANEKASLIAAVVKKSSDVIIEQTPRGLEEAPGVLLKVTKRGLTDLLKDERVKHVTYHPDAEAIAAASGDNI